MKSFMKVPERSHKCSVCGAAFLTRVGRREHEKAHGADSTANGITPYVEPRKRHIDDERESA